jgi:hypothetical protein
MHQILPLPMNHGLMKFMKSMINQCNGRDVFLIIAKWVMGGGR